MLERTEELAETQLEVVVRLARAAELHDDDTGEHVERMSRMCGEVALELGLPPAARRHDPARGGAARRRQDRRPGRDPAQARPPDRGGDGRRCAATWSRARCCSTGSDSPVLQVAEVIVATHHERWDGRGYPKGLAGERDPARGADRRGVRRLRRAHAPAAVQGGVGLETVRATRSRGCAARTSTRPSPTRCSPSSGAGHGATDP